MTKLSSEENQQKWKTLIEQQRQSQMSVKKWCQKHQIPPTTFQYWKDKLFPNQLEKTSFTEIKIKRADTICLQGCGIYIRLGFDCDPNLRKQLLALFA